MRTCHIGAFGFGNLGDELCLIEAMQAFPSAEAYAFSEDPVWTRRCVPGLAGCFADAAEMRALKPDRIVFGGGFIGTARAFAAWMPPLADAAVAGVEVHIHNIGLGRMADTSWLDDRVRGLFPRLAGFSVRDYLSFERVAELPLGRLPTITLYPEVDVAPEHELAEELLPRGGRPLLGLSVIPTPAMADCLGQEAARVRALLEEFRAFAIVPVVSTMHRAVAQEEDATAIAAFAEMLLPGQPILAPQLLERPFWRSRLTPRRLKGIIARCDVLVTQRKHNAIHGIGVGVRTIGLHPLLDDSLRRTFVALGHRLPPGSRCVGLDGPAEAPA